MTGDGLHPDLLAALSAMLGEPATAPPPDTAPPDDIPTTEGDDDDDA